MGGVAGGKATNLAKLLRAGYRVPQGFCITSNAYRLMVSDTDIVKRIEIELGRKRLDKMRWEEIWDAALRIRSMFLNSEIPNSINSAVEEAYIGMLKNKTLVVRSSAIGEDSAGLSFAGLHESLVGVSGLSSLMHAVRVVWASLWSDAALLYRREMSLDPRTSAMAVVVQEFVPGGPSGVAFGRDPRDPKSDCAMIEAVPGENSELVDGIVDPDRWTIIRDTGKTTEWKPGKRDGDEDSITLLDQEDLQLLLGVVLAIESMSGWEADVEWTGRKSALTILQARPITSLQSTTKDDERQWYLSLRPNSRRLKELARRVTDELIPRLEMQGRELAEENLESLSDRQLSASIRKRLEAVHEWQQIYVDDFIPLAHGVRQLGVYYNNAVNPEDPYEFMELLHQEDMLASKRNNRIVALAEMVRCDSSLKKHLTAYDEKIHAGNDMTWISFTEEMRKAGVGSHFLEEMDALLKSDVDVAYQGERLAEHPEVFVHTILELAGVQPGEKNDRKRGEPKQATAEDMERKLLDAVGQDRTTEALEVLELGRLSWRLRDDDNILIGRLESQLLRSLEVAAESLRKRGQLSEYERLNDRVSLILAEALVYPPGHPINLPVQSEAKVNGHAPIGMKARQIIGQPASPGIATGQAAVVRSAEDSLNFKAGNVLVCDAIQPTMTHIVPLACAIVERRGGMLIHGAIIARELGIPCVNGVVEATEFLKPGELVTVDGYLGIVTIGPPELHAETARRDVSSDG
jgi:pyruvate,water dikinase